VGLAASVHDPVRAGREDASGGQGASGPLEPRSPRPASDGRPAGEGRDASSFLAPVLVLLLCLLLTACSARRAEPQAGSPAADLPATGALLDGSGRPLGEKAFQGMAAGADLVLLGETHDSPCDHAQQARLIRLMAAAGQAPAIGLEMVPAVLQPELDRFNRGEIGPDGLAEAVDWPRTWGYPFALYRPIFEAAAELRLPVYGLNAPHEVVRAVARGGLEALTPQQRSLVPERIIEPAPAQMESLREVFSLHGSPDDDPARFARFVLAQSLWDTAMAARALEVRRSAGRPVAVVAGGGHVEFGWGIELRAASLDPSAGALTVMPWRGGDAPVPEGYADVLYVCPLMTRSRLGMILFQSEAGQVVVSEVEPGSTAETLGLAAGDVIEKANGADVTTLSDLHRAGFAAMRDGAPLVLTLDRLGVKIAVEYFPKAAKP